MTLDDDHSLARRHLAKSPTVLAIVAVLAVGLASTRLDATLLVVAVTGTVAQVLVAAVLIRDSQPRVSLKSAFAVVWVITFTLRLLQITLAPDVRYHHPIVFDATDASKVGMWILSTVGFAAFWVGSRGGSRIVKRIRLAEVRLPRHAVLTLSYVFLLISYGLVLSGLTSGLLDNIGQFYLFIIAYGSFQSARANRSIGPEIGVVLAAALLAVLFGYKEFAVLPVLSWILGQWAGGRRVLSLGGVVVVLIGSFFYIGVQSQRTAVLLNEDPSFLPALEQGLTKYDLVIGTYQDKSGLAILSNPAAALASRLAGVDSLFVIQARTPSVIPYQGGRTLWQPTLSIVPGASRFLDPELSNLSLGGYFTQKYWSLRPEFDDSFQAPTVPGEFYMNFGVYGLVFGMTLFGLLYSAVDERTRVISPTAVGLFAYAAFPLLAIERNVAYVLVTGAIRYAVGLTIIRLLVLWGFGPAGRSTHSVVEQPAQ